MRAPFLSKDEQQKAPATRLKELTEEESNYVWEEILDDHIKNKHESSKPKIIFIMGQPGSGKSTKLAPMAKRLFRQEHQDFCLVDLDELKLYHPYTEALDSKGIFARHYNGKAARTWYEKLVQATIDNKLNVVHDKPAKKIVPYGFTVTDIAKKAALYKQNGYEVEVHALATNKELSFQGCLKREEEILSHNSEPSNKHKPNRHIGRAEHDDLYHDQGTAISELERDKNVDKLYIWNRDSNEPIAVFDYQNRDPEYSARNVFDKERERPLSAKDLINMSANWSKIATSKKKRCGENHYEYKEIMQLWENTKQQLKTITTDTNTIASNNSLNIAKAKKDKSR